MNVFMGYNPTVAKQVKVSVWVKEIDGAEPILPATPKDGDCFIVFDTDDDVLADNPSSKKAYANGSWGDAGGGGGGGGDYPVITFSEGQDPSCSWSYEKVLNRTSEENNLACIMENELEGHVLSAGGTWLIEGTHLICAVVFGLKEQYVEYLPNGTLVPASDNAIGGRE